MKENLQALNRNLLLKAMKTILFIIPIGIITNNIFISIYGDYSICNNMNFFSEHFRIICKNAIFSIVIFSAIFSISYFLEKNLLPDIFLFFDKRSKNLEINKKENKVIIYKFFKKVLGFNPYIFLNRKEIRRYFYQQIMYVFITFILWLISINTSVSYLSIFVFIFLFIYIHIVINTLIHEFN